MKSTNHSLDCVQFNVGSTSKMSRRLQNLIQIGVHGEKRELWNLLLGNGICCIWGEVLELRGEDVFLNIPKSTYRRTGGNLSCVLGEWEVRKFFHRAYGRTTLNPSAFGATPYSAGKNSACTKYMSVPREMNLRESFDVFIKMRD